MRATLTALVPAVRIELGPFQVSARTGIGIARTAAIDAVALSKSCIDSISDPEVRRVVETLLFAAAAGGLLGVAIGGLAGGAACAQVGALVGVGIGFAAASVALVTTLNREPELLES
jgi:hypothetical protein